MDGTSYRKMHYELFLGLGSKMTLKYLPPISSIWAANSTVLLYHFANRIFDCLENPLFPDYGSIRSRAHRQEVGAEFHWHDIAKGYHPLQPNPANVAALGLYRDGKSRLGIRAYRETGRYRQERVLVMELPKQRVIIERFGGLDEGW